MNIPTVYWVTLNLGVNADGTDRRFRALVTAAEPYAAALGAVRRLHSKGLEGSADLWCTREIGPA